MSSYAHEISSLVTPFLINHITYEHDIAVHDARMEWQESILMFYRHFVNFCVVILYRHVWIIEQQQQKERLLLRITYEKRWWPYDNYFIPNIYDQLIIEQ